MYDFQFSTSAMRAICTPISLSYVASVQSSHFRDYHIPVASYISSVSEKQEYDQKKGQRNTSELFLFIN